VQDLLGLDGRMLVIFDGRCGLCNRAVRWFLVRDRRDRLRFAASEGALVAGILERHGVTAWGTGPDTILVVRDAGGAAEQVLARSEAVRALLRELPQPWPAVERRWGGFRGQCWTWLPAHCPVAASHRGTAGELPTPTAEERRRFL